ncbi:sugar-binding domain-containing protein [uncultured Draconibacterium sp.]|uniref:sugar-binding domain-containing protein n=1 Tax=uncultured Draconibacterium sp. TaxID=1573823 RepID=UPI0025DBB686|nr:sugar-binding domain-containing protein [uncultured Draconibacterium sp.]
MKNVLLLFFLASLLFSCSKQETTRIVEDFNDNWKFNLGEHPEALQPEFDDSDWRILNVPHDWSIEEGYHKHTEKTAASTGFVKGGIGWYRKSFTLTPADKGKQITILFDGVYNNSTVWINGHKLGFRPNGYSSFTYDLSRYLNYDGSANVLAVKVDRTFYADSRWYTGSGIYRKVQLIKKSPLHIAQWGIKITTPEVLSEQATVQVKTHLENSGALKTGNISINYQVFNPENKLVSEKKTELDNTLENTCELRVPSPLLWDVENPALYTLKVEVFENGKKTDVTTERFGIRYFSFDADTGFSLNGKALKIKGVNLHHDAGAVGAAVPKALWKYRVEQLKSIGTNAIRMAHNPHSKELMEVCDEMGMLVMAEAFDEWMVPKGKNLVFIGDNKAPEAAAAAYPRYFNQWAEQDLKDLIQRDFNHPSVIMWSIGNEIEWTFPHYSQTYNKVNGQGKKYYAHTPIYDSLTVRTAFNEITGGSDLLAETAKKLAHWVKEEDTTRPVTAGSVQPSIGLASGYGDNLDVYGFNYRAVEYDAAHKEYPNTCILGSENWGAYSEWKNCVERDFVAGIFVWTGFAYLGEAGPWPRKGLEIAFFDYAGVKTPRGHFYECLWKNAPKIYMVTTPASESEFSYSENKGWNFEMDYYEPPFWPELRKWEWYKTYPKWKYDTGEQIVVQTYTNCDEAELFLNGKSLGKQKRSDFADDNIIKWLVPYTAGELKVVGYSKGKETSTYTLATFGKAEKIAIRPYKTTLKANGYDVTPVLVELLDKNGNPVVDNEQTINFEVSGEGLSIGVDNGWENNIQNPKSNAVETYQGRAIVYIQSTKNSGKISVQAKTKQLSSETIVITSE